MQIESCDLWPNIESKINDFLLRKDLDPVLIKKLESLVNHYNGLLAIEKSYEVSDELRIITSMLSNKDFYIIRNIDKDDAKDLNVLKEDLKLLNKILLQESRMIKDKIKPVSRDRLPNIDNDKSLKIFDEIEV